MEVCLNHRNKHKFSSTCPKKKVKTQHASKSKSTTNVSKFHIALKPEQLLTANT